MTGSKVNNTAVFTPMPSEARASGRQGIGTYIRSIIDMEPLHPRYKRRIKKKAALSYSMTHLFVLGAQRGDHCCQVMLSE